MGFYSRFILPHLLKCACGGRAFQRVRAPLLSQARGVVADIGFGAGANIPFFKAEQVERVYAVEPAAEMLSLARKEIAASPISIEPIVAGGEATGLGDASVDTVLFTYVLCTAPDTPGMMAEARRILKPGGQILFCEHGLAPDAPVARKQANIEPLWRKIGGGCHLTRDPVVGLEAGGFRCDPVERFYLKGAPAFAGFTYRGSARLVA
jgi:SAM-dependent methyltransferase